MSTSKPTQTSSISNRMWSATFVLIITVSLLASMNGNGVHNGVALLIEQEGGSTSISGIIIAVFAFSALVARFVAGPLSDVRGRKPVLIMGTLFMIAGCLLGAFTHSVYLMIPARILMGFGFSTCTTSAAAAVADTVPPERLGEGIGYQGMAFGLAIALGPMLGVAVAEQGRFTMFATYFCVGIAALICVLACRFAPQPMVSAKEKPAKRGIAGFVDRYIERTAIAAAVVGGLIMAPMVIYMAMVSVWSDRLSISGIGWYFLISAIVMVGIRLVAGKAFDRLHPCLLLVPSFALGIAGFLLLHFFPCTASMLAAAVCYGLFCGVSQPVATAAAFRRAPIHRRGAASATYYIGCDVGVGCGSFIWGSTIAAWGFGVTFVLASACIVAGIILSLIFFRK